MHTAPSPSSVPVSAPAVPPPVGPCRIGPHRFDPEQCEIEREGEWLPLQRQPCRVLAYLVEHRDRFVSKQELHDAAWPDSVVSDAAPAHVPHGARQGGV